MEELQVVKEEPQVVEEVPQVGMEKVLPQAEAWVSKVPALAVLLLELA